MRHLALPAAIALNFAVGYLFCWSVFVAPFETALGDTRAGISAVFSLAVASYVLGIFAAPRLLRRLCPAPAALGVSLAVAAGLALASAPFGMAPLLAGFAVLFAFAAGAGYSLCLEIANADLPLRRSLATGLAVASLALSGLVLPPLLALVIAAHGPSATMGFAAAAFAAAGAAIAGLLALSRVRRPGEGRPGRLFAAPLTESPRVFVPIWLGFLCTASGGLMTVGHAANIAADFGVAPEASYLGPVVVSIGYILAATSAGLLSDRFSGRRVLVGFAALMAGALAFLYALPSPAMSLTALFLVGCSFGSTASSIPVTLVAYFGAGRLGLIYGRIIIAYGIAGLVMPWLAGALYDWRGSYGPALLSAAGLAAAGLAAAGSLVNLALPKGTLRRCPA